MLSRCGFPLALCLVSANVVTAAGATAAPDTVTRPSPANVSRARSSPVSARVEFPGGSLLAYITAVKERFPDTNVVHDPDAASLSVPPISLPNVTPGGALRLLEFVRPSGEGGVSVHVIPQDNEAGAGEIFMVTGWTSSARVADTATEFRPSNVAPQLVRVFSLTDLMAGIRDKQKIKERREGIKTAIEAAFAMQPGSKVVLRIHEDSGLLMLLGSAVEGEAASKVIAELAKSARAQSLEESSLTQVERLQQRLSALESEFVTFRRASKR